MAPPSFLALSTNPSVFGPFLAILASTGIAMILTSHASLKGSSSSSTTTTTTKKGQVNGDDHDEKKEAARSYKLMDGMTYEEVREMRRQTLAPNLTLFFAEEPLCIVRGEGVYIYDDQGRRYLDCVNNVAHIGHSHPRIQSAATRQLQEINTNTRYLHPCRSRYAHKLLSTFPPDLNVVFFVCSGSEANDLALRLARAYTGHHDVVTLGSAYHGHTTSMIDISPYKHQGREGDKKEWVHIAPAPDTFRGKYAGMEDAGDKYAQDLREVVSSAVGSGRTIAAWYAESILACGGQVPLPPGYLSKCYDMIHGVGGVCVADEVQVGLGRSGDHFWAFESQGVVPDIVTLGKPLGNGFPIAAVVTRKEIAEAFSRTTEYFNTFGGCNLAMTFGETTLDVIIQDNLQDNARVVGDYAKDLLSHLMDHHEGVVGDVRGQGLMLGIELVEDLTTKTPAPTACAWVVRRMRDLGVHVSIDGPYHNVIKIKPPMCFTKTDAEVLYQAVDQALGEWVKGTSSSSSTTTTTTTKVEKKSIQRTP